VAGEVWLETGEEEGVVFADPKYLRSEGDFFGVPMKEKM
jgi:hypothetical protein